VRIDPEEYADLDLRAHALLADAPLHDAWAIDLPGEGEHSVADVRAIVSFESLAQIHPVVRLLFSLRGWLGRIFGWDDEPPRPSGSSYLSRLSEEERQASRVAPGTPEGPFRVLYVSDREAISEIRNATVHAFSVFALFPQPGGHRLTWAIHVRPVGRVTAWYMRLIDPFRRLLIYPAVLRYIRNAWELRASDPSRPP
jgi:hypothetical protein